MSECQASSWRERAWLHDVGDLVGRRVRKVCPEPRPGARYPDLHSFRRTTATALERAGAPRSVIRRVLGHSQEEDVTAGYIEATDEDCLLWLDQAALLIDGDPLQNVVALAPPTPETWGRTGRAVGAGAVGGA